MSCNARLIAVACFIVLLNFLFLNEVQAQDQVKYKNAFTIKYFGLSMHLKESPYPEIFPHRLDRKGYLVLNIGGIAGYERFVVRDVLSIRVEQGIYTDCASAFAGFSHIGWRGLIFRKGRHSLNGGIGPTLVYRRDWNEIEGYEDDGYFNRSGKWQYRFYWYGGEFEYNYKLKERLELSATLVPGIPELMSVGLGIRRSF